MDEIRTAIHVRVSTQEQAIKGYSIGEQLNSLRNYCSALHWTVFKEYVDAGYSGASMDRPALQELISDIRLHKIDKVVVYKLDRLSRSQKDTLNLIEDVFLANDVDFISISENFDTSTPLGKAMIGILAVFAQLEREQIKERMQMGKLARAKSGKFHPSRLLPTGYSYINGELVIDEFESALVKQAFERYSQGFSLVQICDEFNEKGFYHKAGQWIPTSLSRILSNQIYIGKINYGGQVFDGNHQPIIDEKLFYDVQAMKKVKYDDYCHFNRRSGRSTSYLGGFLICGCCGAKYSKAQSGKYKYYSCNSRNRKNRALIKDLNCHNKTWKMEELDSLVLDEIRKIRLESIEATPNDLDDKKRIENEINLIDKRISRLIQLYSLDEMPVDLIKSQIMALKDKKDKLSIELKKQPQKLSIESSVEISLSLDEAIKKGSYDDIRAIISALIEKIVLKDDNVLIYWKF